MNKIKKISNSGTPTSTAPKHVPVTKSTHAKYKQVFILRISDIEFMDLDSIFPRFYIDYRALSIKNQKIWFLIQIDYGLETSGFLRRDMLYFINEKVNI